MIISSDKSLKDVLTFCFDGWGYEVFLHEAPLSDIEVVKRSSPDVIVADVQSAKRPDMQICHLLKEDFMTAYIPIITIINKRQLRQQLLEVRQGVDDYLIKPPDPLDLRIRIEMALKRSQYSLHSSPLTGLPGVRIVEDALTERIQKGSSFSFGYVDIDNFKYFNDVYGYLKGDRVIMQVAHLLYTCVKHYGNPHDFIGHIGGDDFVFLTSIEKYKEIASSFIEFFDRLVPYHYSAQDQKQGFVVAKDRARTSRQIPFMSLSIAVVNRRHDDLVKSIVEINDRVAEIKGFLKAIPKSKFMVDRRSGSNEKEIFGPQVCQSHILPRQSYKPLGQILIERNLLSSEQLDEALKINWRRGVMLGEVIRDMGLVSAEDMEQALIFQQESALAKLS